MADAMTFPKTIKEFIDQYSFKDSDEVYTNGSMLILTFRVEQAVEHYTQEIRNKAIDEFAEKICDKVTDDSLQVMLPDGFRADVVTVDYVAEMAWGIAGQMRDGE